MVWHSCLGMVCISPLLLPSSFAFGMGEVKETIGGWGHVKAIEGETGNWCWFLRCDFWMFID